ncbi:putative mitochondrial-processing peptidase subunit beta, mitochondrial [Vitis vinifera]|uniref:Putative mitochondrial-processing peptidase subunit beta, mitochondrial n=1 Tax=Vitis vinifera TaxID=29760 RepID=A0A438D4J8_VITVI|nr:putative mitochondrial-processing peptidase subunit beta, mitochondrial [Vitis vinifera]
MTFPFPFLEALVLLLGLAETGNNTTSYVYGCPLILSFANATYRLLIHMQYPYNVKVEKDAGQLSSVLLLMYFVSGAFSTNGFTTPLAMDFAATQLIAMQRENDDMGIGNFRDVVKYFVCQAQYFNWKLLFASLFDPDCLDDLAYAIMYEISKLCYRVSEADVTRARNQPLSLQRPPPRIHWKGDAGDWPTSTGVVRLGGIKNLIFLLCVCCSSNLLFVCNYLLGTLLQLKSSLLLHIDGTSPVAEDIGRQLLTYGRRIPFAELFARIDAVDASTVKRVANRFIFDRDVAIAAMGPIQGLPDYNWFRRRTYWLRY